MTVTALARVEQAEHLSRAYGLDPNLSINDAAAALGVQPSTIRAWILQGRIGSSKQGARRLIPLSEVKRHLANGYRRAWDNDAQNA